VTSSQRAYLFLQCGVGAALVNALLNAGIGWVITVGLTEFPIWRVPGAAFDLAATAFGVVFGTCLVAVFQVRIDVTKRKITPPEVGPALGSVLARLPQKTFPRGVFLGMLAVPAFTPPLFVAFVASGISALDRSDFIALKAGFSAIIAGFATPFIVLAALRDHAARAMRPPGAPTS